MRRAWTVSEAELKQAVWEWAERHHPDATVDEEGEETDEISIWFNADEDGSVTATLEIGEEIETEGAEYWESEDAEDWTEDEDERAA